MDNSLVLTIILAILVMGLVVAGLAIGFILTGKQKLRRGCGLTPRSKNDKSKESGASCPMCGDKKSCEQPENESDSDNRKNDQ